MFLLLFWDNSQWFLKFYSTHWDKANIVEKVSKWSWQRSDQIFQLVYVLCLCHSLNYQNFLNPFLVSFFFGVGKEDISQGYRLFWKVRGSLTMVAMMWILHSQLLFFRHHTPPPSITETLIIVKRHVPDFKRKPSHRFFAMSIESSSLKVCFWNSATLQR